MRPADKLHHAETLHFNPRTPCGVRHHIAIGIIRFRDNFNPRTPCGVRQAVAAYVCKYITFQSTHPVRGATESGAASALREGISIHAPRAGCDSDGVALRRERIDFNPRTPCGVRRQNMGKFTVIPEFQSTHPVRGATANMYNLVCSYFCNFTKSDVCLLTLYLFYHAISTENVVFSRFSAVRSAPGIHVRSRFAPRQSISSPSGA